MRYASSCLIRLQFLGSQILSQLLVYNLFIADRFKLEDSLLSGPREGCRGADAIVVVHDVSTRFTREALDKRVLRLLCLFGDVPSVLVLNKMDTIPKSRRVYDLIRDGVQSWGSIVVDRVVK